MKGADYVTFSVLIFACCLIEPIKSFEIFQSIYFRGCNEAARVAPEATAAGEAFRDVFLALFLEVLSQITG